MELIDYAILCHQSYTGEGPVKWIDVEDLRFGVVECDGCQVIIFRGSADFENWLRDFSILPVRSKGGYLAHKGFVDAMDTLWPHVLDNINKSVPIVTIGHSLGGAIAVLCAEALGCWTITFGCPRVYFRFGKKPFMYHKRIICSDDPVPDMPFLMFNHTCKPDIVLTDEGFSPVAPQDHFITHYIERLGGN